MPSSRYQACVFVIIFITVCVIDVRCINVELFQQQQTAKPVVTGTGPATADLRFSEHFVPHMMAEDGSFPRGEGHQRWGYVEVRPGAYLFWWLYYTTHPDGYMNRPWLIWLEGGPGNSATVLANFGAIGPTDAEGTPRNTSWVNSVSVMFIDSPAGVGFSYYEEGATVPNTTEDTTADLIELYKVFTNSYTEFKELPLYIFGHSYGGRASAALAYFMRKAEERGELECNLAGIGMGNAWVSPSDSTLAVPPLFLHMGYIGNGKYAEMMEKAHDIATRMQAAVTERKVDDKLLGDAWGMYAAAAGVRPYNLLQFTPQPPGQENLINTVIKERLRIIPEHVPQSNLPCCNGLVQHDLFRETFGWADEVLKMGDIQVAVYQGNLDVVCPTKGAMDWVDRFTWEGMEEYRKQPFTPVDAPNTPPTTDMYVRAHQQLKFYTIVGSGHYVTMDKPEVALHMLNRVMDDLDHGTE